MRYGGILSAVLAALLAGGIASPVSAASDRARLTGLSDVSFGTINAFTDQVISQSICAYSSSRTDQYAVTAMGDATGGSFSLASGSSQLPYEVLWTDTPNQVVGTALVPNSAVGGFTSTGNQQTCNSGPSTTASLIIIIRSTALNAARAGDYTGSLTITISPQ
jgi:hypothetical protein